MPRRRQAGGAMKKIGPLTPTITSPETMAEQCQFQFIVAHGSTYMHNLMIVPNDTFILFIGASGYSTYITKGRKEIIFSNEFPNTEAYYKHLYDTFFSPEDVATRNATYPDARVYTPGDILHNTNLFFYSESSQSQVFFHGYHELPITNPPTGPGGSLADPHTHRTMYLPLTMYVPFVSTAVARGLVLENVIRRAQVKPEVKEEWEKLIKITEYNEAHQELLRMKTANPKVFELSYWFQNPVYIMVGLINEYEKSHPNNKLGSSLPQKISFSDFLDEYPNAKIGSTKQYRFVIVVACRGPDVNLGELHDPSFANVNQFQALPPSQLTHASVTQKLARRASFSAKQPAEVCPVGVGAPPMNLTSVKKAMEDIAPFIKEYSGRELEFLRLIYESFFQIKPTTKVKILKKKGDLLSYDKSIRLGAFLKAIDELFLTFPLLESEDPANVERKTRFHNVVQAFHNMTHAYVSSAIKNNSINPEHTFGEHILTHTIPPENKYLVGIELRHKPNRRDTIRNAFQKKLLPTEEELEAIRPVAGELFEIYIGIIDIYASIHGLTDRYNTIRKPETELTTEKELLAMIEQAKSFLKLSSPFYKELHDIKGILNRLLKSIDQLTARHLGLSKVKFTALEPKFGKSDPRIRDFTLREACVDMLVFSDAIYTSNVALESSIKSDIFLYNQKMYTIKTLYKDITDVLRNITSRAQLTQESWDTFARRLTKVFEFIDTYSKNVAQKRITEETYNSTIEELQAIQSYYETYDETVESGIHSEISKIRSNIKYTDDILNKPIVSYFPEFKTPYSSDPELTFHTYATIIRTKIIIPKYEMSDIIGNIVDKKKEFERVYSTQKQQAANVARPKTKRSQAMTQRNRRPNAAMANGVAVVPKPNQTQKSKGNRPPAWVLKMRERQAKRNQTKRNGNASGKNRTANAKFF